MESRFLASLARETVFYSRILLGLGTLLFALGLYSFLATDTVELTGQNAVLFVVLLFTVPLFLTFLLKSFRKVLIALTPSLFALAYTVLVLNLLGLKVTGFSTLFLSFALPLSAGLNYIFVKDYFWERNKPTTVADAVWKVYNKFRKMSVGLTAIMVVTFLAMATFATNDVGPFGIATALAVMFSFLTNMVLLPPCAMFYEKRRAVKALTGVENEVLKYAEKFGTNTSHFPYFASWLGKSVTDVEKFVERLEAKGYLGRNFFSFDDPLVWFLLFASYVLGASLSQGTVSGGNFINFVVVFLATIGATLLAPSRIEVFDRTVRRTFGFLVILVAILISGSNSVMLLTLIVLMALASFVSIYYSKLQNLVSNLAVAVYYAAVFLAGWTVFRSVTDTAKWWAVGLLILILLVQLVVKEEAYLKL